MNTLKNIRDFTILTDVRTFCVLRENQKSKNPDFAWKSGFYCLLLFFKPEHPRLFPWSFSIIQNLVKIKPETVEYRAGVRFLYVYPDL